MSKEEKQIAVTGASWVVSVNTTLLVKVSSLKAKLPKNDASDSSARNAGRLLEIAGLVTFPSKAKEMRKTKCPPEGEQFIAYSNLLHAFGVRHTKSAEDYHENHRKQKKEDPADEGDDSHFHVDVARAVLKALQEADDLDSQKNIKVVCINSLKNE